MNDFDLQKAPAEENMQDGAPEGAAPAVLESDGAPASEETEGVDTALPFPDFAETERADLAILKAQFPEVAAMVTLAALENPGRYGALRELGLSPAEAYLATSKARRTPPDNRSHLQSAMPRSVAGGEGMRSADLESARALFSDLSDSEIRRLYQKVKA